MTILDDKKIAILGLGQENYALVRFFINAKLRKKCLPAGRPGEITKMRKMGLEITICDKRSKKELGERYALIEGEISESRLQGARVRWRLGKNYDKDLKDFDLIFRSPGYPLFSPSLKQAMRAGVLVTSAMRLFFELCPSENIVGVTGTKGKGTTASLIEHILKFAGKRVWLGGNIGVAPFEFISKIKRNDWVVLELSSFQLEDMKVSPKIAVVTNFYKEHLMAADPNNPNHHKSLVAYRRAKLNIIKYQGKGDFAVVNKRLVTSHWSLGNGKYTYFDKSDLPSKLIGEHNKENIEAAVEVTKAAGVDQRTIKKAVANFKGLEHRLELVRSFRGVRYYNDSFATTSESTIIALRSFESPIVLLAGGADKGADFRPMLREVKKRCRALILLRGKGTDRLKKYLSFSIFHLSFSEFSDLSKAVKKARALAKKGDVVLLSPGCASFGMFKNYKERGEKFKKAVWYLR